MKNKIKQLICLHNFEVYGMKYPSKTIIHGKDRIGTVYYLRCNKCNKCKTRFSNIVQGDYI